MDGWLKKRTPDLLPFAALVRFMGPMQFGTMTMKYGSQQKQTQKYTRISSGENSWLEKWFKI